MLRITLITVWLATAVCADEPATAELTVDEIVAKTNRVSYYQGADGRAQVAMKIVDAQGRERNREFTILRWDEPKEGTTGDEHCGDQRMYVYFHKPADVNKMSFLVWKHLDKDDDRWLYLPALDLVKRISAADKRTSFVGSHFFYEDVSGRHIDDDHHELVETTKNYYVLKNTPKDPKPVEFKYFKMWIAKGSFVVVRTRFFDKDPEADGSDPPPYRTYEVPADGFKMIQGYPTIVKSTMTDHRTGGHTDLEYKDVSYDIGLPDEIFSERYLRKPPRKYLR